MKKYYAYLQVKQDIARWNRYKSEAAKERAINTSLANNFVSEFTSLLVVLPRPSSRSDPVRPSQEPNLYLSGSGGNSGMTHSPTIDSIDKFDNGTGSDIEDPDECKIILYSGVYHGGNELILRDSVPDLGPWDFVELLESLKVEGTCDWIIFDGEKQVVTSVIIIFCVQVKTIPVRKKPSLQAGAIWILTTWEMLHGLLSPLKRLND